MHNVNIHTVYFLFKSPLLVVYCTAFKVYTQYTFYVYVLTGTLPLFRKGAHGLSDKTLSWTT